MPSTTLLDTERHRVIVGEAVEALPDELDRLDREHALVVTSATLLRETPLAHRVADVLGERVAADAATIRGHTPEEDVDAAVQAAEKSYADVVVSLGGGGAVDGGKHVRWRVTDELEEPDELVHVAIPTTLSGAEFTHLAGITVDGTKTGVADMDLIPEAALLDPSAQDHTPRDLWAWTGVRGLDTGIEGYLQADDEDVARRCLASVEHLAEALPPSVRDAADHEAARACYEASWESSIGNLEADAARGPSHVLGKALGAPYGIQHGLTSAITLPMVLEWWATEKPERTADVSEALGGPAEPEAAANRLRGWLDELGVERPPLRDLGVPREALDEVEEDLLGPVAPELLDRLEELW
jgi:alcohol dehydrogenase class IV